MCKNLATDLQRVFSRTAGGRSETSGMPLTQVHLENECQHGDGGGNSLAIATSVLAVSVFSAKSQSSF